MHALLGPFAAVALLLVFTGIPKLVRPLETSRALGQTGLPGGMGAARTLGAIEVLAGVGALAISGPAAAGGVAFLYACFAGFVLVGRARGVSSCGCVGRPDTPPTLAHLGFDLGAVAVAVGYAASGAPSPTFLLLGDPLGALPLVGSIALLTWLAHLTISVLPAVSTTR